MTSPTAVSTRALRLLTVALGVWLVVCGTAGTAAAGSEGPDPVGVWPLSPTPEVVAGFDPPDSPFGAGHRGVDLAGVVGQQVHTALAGTVTYAGLLAGRGVVVVDHGATRTTYQPVAAGVRVGDHLARGDPIGTLELGGSHCFPRACLHWGWIADPDTYLDPLRLVGMGPVRLLPLWRDTPSALSCRRLRSSRHERAPTPDGSRCYGSSAASRRSCENRVDAWEDPGAPG